MKRVSQKSLALLMALLLLLPLGQIPTAAAVPAELNIALISDPHYFPESMAGGYGEVFDAGQIVGHPIEQAPGVLRSALAAVKARALRGEIDFLLIPGDLTREGEKGGHEALAAILAQFEAEAHIPVAVIPGNHDIDNGGAADFSTGVKVKAPSVTPAEFYDIYEDFGFDLGNLARYTTDLSVEGALSYAADLNADYRLVALDTRVRRISPALRAWAVGQCEDAVAAGQTVVAMGHHNLNEQLKGQLRVMQNQGIENMREISEEFADAGMHFYFSGHLHMSEISPWYSDSGEVLYDIIVPGLYSFPGDYRVVNFSAENGRIEAEISSYAPDEILTVTANGADYDPYYPAALEYSFGWKGQGMAGFTKANMRQALGKQLEELAGSGGIAALIKKQVDLGPINALFEYLDKRLIQPEVIIGLLEGLVDDAFALPVSKLPCNRFIGELGFGHPTKPGTVGDLASSALVYMFWKKDDPKDDPFMQDVLRRLQNGELLDQLLNFAIPKVLDVLGTGVLPLLIDCMPVSRALGKALNSLGCPLLTVPLLALVATPGIRGTLNKSLYDLASNIMTSSSPSGRGTDAVLVYDGPVAAPTGPETFRLPYNLRYTLGGDCKSAEITWYTKDSLTNPGLKLTDKNGAVVPGVTITLSTQFENITADQIDLAIMQIMGTNMRAAKHTAKITGLKPGKEYKFSAGDTEYGWWAAPQALARESKVLGFFRQVWQWIVGMWNLMLIAWKNRSFY